MSDRESVSGPEASDVEETRPVVSSETVDADRLPDFANDDRVKSSIANGARLVGNDYDSSSEGKSKKHAYSKFEEEIEDLANELDELDPKSRDNLDKHAKNARKAVMSSRLKESKSKLNSVMSKADKEMRLNTAISKSWLPNNKATRFLKKGQLSLKDSAKSSFNKVKKVDDYLTNRMWDSTKYAILMILMMWVLVLGVNLGAIKNAKNSVSIALYTIASIMTPVIWWPIRKRYLNYYFGATSKAYSKADYDMDRKNRERRNSEKHSNRESVVTVATTELKPSEIKNLSYQMARANPKIKTVCFISTSNGMLAEEDCDKIDKEMHDNAEKFKELDRQKRIDKQNEEIARAAIESNNKILDAVATAKVTVSSLAVPSTINSTSSNYKNVVHESDRHDRHMDRDDDLFDSDRDSYALALR